MEGNKKSVCNLIIAIITVAVLVVAMVGVMLTLDYFQVDTSVATPDEVTTLNPVFSSYDEVILTETTEEVTTPNGEEYTLTQDWGELAKINNEIVGWIYMPNTVINYPVLYHDGDGYGSQYYIHRNYDRSYLYAGSIFIDYRSGEGPFSRNILTHGHNMNNGSMYAAITQFGKWSPNVSAYKNAPTLFFNTPAGNEQWVIFAYYKTSTLTAHGDFFNYLQGDFDSDAQFMNYIYNVKERSLIDVPVPINEDDQIITLSTCSYEFTEFRTVAVARKIRPGENVSSYINNAKANSDPVWPEVYYDTYGGTRPTLTTFKTEYERGNISWYDGSGVLEGHEWLPSVQGNSSYTVTFINYDGSIIDTQSVVHGEAAVAPDDPVKPSDDYYDYVFQGWQQDFSSVDCNMTVAPKFEPVLRVQ
ncbi:MAG: sortase [Ruminococcus sp.]|nr:sortase [Ruminococcus sp.]